MRRSEYWPRRLSVSPEPRYRADRPAPRIRKIADRITGRPTRLCRYTGNTLVEGVGVSGPGGFDTVLVVDFGAQYAQLIARRVRECHVYSEIVPSTMPVSEMLAKRPEGDHLVRRAGLGLRRGRPGRADGLFEAGVPVFGICYGHQVLVRELGGTVERTGAAEYGGTPLHVAPEAGAARRARPRAQRVDVAR